MDNFLETLEPIKQEIISRLYGINELKDPSPDSVDNNGHASKSSKPRSILDIQTHDVVADELSVNGDPEAILMYASSNKENSLVFTEQDIKRLEQEALRELARGRRKK